MNVDSKFTQINFMLYSFIASRINSTTTHDSYAVSIPTATPRLSSIVAPTKDITTPVPTIKTNDYGIYVDIPRPPLPNTIPPLVHQTAPTTFTQLYQIFLYTNN